METKTIKFFKLEELKMRNANFLKARGMKPKNIKFGEMEMEDDDSISRDMMYQFLFVYLMVEDQVCRERLDFISLFNTNKLNKILDIEGSPKSKLDIDSYKHSEKTKQLKIKYKLDTDDKLTEAITNATIIQKRIIMDLRKRVNELDYSTMMRIMNNQEETKEFLQKYFTKKEDITDDIIFQCDKYVY